MLVDCVLDLGPEGVLLASTAGLLRCEGDTTTVVPLPYEEMGGLEVDYVVKGRGDTLWCFGHYGRLVAWTPRGARVIPFHPPASSLAPTVTSVGLDENGALWVATFEGLFRVSGTRVDYFDEGAGLPSAWINDVLVDRDHVLWVATEGGLCKLSQPGVRNYVARDGLPVGAVWAIAELPGGRVCLGTNKGIVVVDTSGAPTVLTSRNGLPEEAIVDMEVGEDGSLWVLGFNQVFNWKEEKFISYPYAPFQRIILSSILPVSSDEIWVGTAAGTYVLDVRTHTFCPHPMMSQIRGSPRVRRLVRSHHGGAWVLGSRLWRWSPDGSVEEVEPPFGTDVGAIMVVLECDDTVLVGTTEGLFIKEGAEWRRVDLGDRFPFEVVRDRGGAFWLGCNEGIARVAGDSVSVFGTYDGVALVEANTNAAILARDGRVWFGGRNVTVIDPSQVHRPKDQAPLVVEAAVGTRLAWLPTGVTCEPGARSVELRLACPSFSNEQEMAFR